MNESEHELRDIRCHVKAICEKLDELVDHLKVLPHQLEMAEVHPLESMAIPPVFETELDLPAHT
jgi:hypothetical protein